MTPDIILKMKIKDLIKQDPGFQFVIDNMELMSSAGRRVMLDEEFLSDASSVAARWEMVQKAVDAVANPDNVRAFNDLRHCLMQLHDLRGTLAALAGHQMLNEVELFEIKNLAYIAGKASPAMGQMGFLGKLPLPDLGDVFATLDPDSTGVVSFYIYDSYDPRLPGLRRELKALQEHGGDQQRIADLIAQQGDIQKDVCLALSDKLALRQKDLSAALETMAYTDFLLAKADLAKRWNLVRPTIADTTSYVALVNPRLRQRNEELGLRYQPVDIALTHGVTLVTGANMAGKTVLLKSVATAQQMVQCGFFAPAASAAIEPVDEVMTSIGDEQNEMNGLSSFASEIIKISNIVQRSRNSRMLVLVDEPARTTNPVEGKALVQALIGLLGEVDSSTLITTHYSQLGSKCRRLRVRGFVEDLCNMPLNPQNINRFIDYSLTEDTSDEVPQEALRIATILGCDSILLERARQALG